MCSGNDLHNGLQNLSLEASTGLSCINHAQDTRESEALKLISFHDRANSGPLSVIIQAMRKLREALIASHRVNDEFACAAYIFIIRATILLRHPDSYHPALLHLLRRTGANPPLQEDRFYQLVEYRVLDLTCRQRNWSEAYKIVSQYDLRHSKVAGILSAVVRGNWVRFVASCRSLDLFQQRLAEHASYHVIDHALSCIGKTYLQLNKSYLEKTFAKQWELLKVDHTITWPLDGDNLIIREIKHKT